MLIEVASKVSSGFLQANRTPTILLARRARPLLGLGSKPSDNTIIITPYFHSHSGARVLPCKEQLLRASEVKSWSSARQRAVSWDRQSALTGGHPQPVRPRLIPAWNGRDC